MRCSWPSGRLGISFHRSTLPPGRTSERGLEIVVGVFEVSSSHDEVRLRVSREVEAGFSSDVVGILEKNESADPNVVR